jgi:hypothetical protein
MRTELGKVREELMRGGQATEAAILSHLEAFKVPKETATA